MSGRSSPALYVLSASVIAAYCLGAVIAWVAT